MGFATNEAKIFNFVLLYWMRCDSFSEIFLLQIRLLFSMNKKELKKQMNLDQVSVWSCFIGLSPNSNCPAGKNWAKINLLHKILRLETIEQRYVRCWGKLLYACYDLQACILGQQLLGSDCGESEGPDIHTKLTESFWDVMEKASEEIGAENPTEQFNFSDATSTECGRAES